MPAIKKRNCSTKKCANAEKKSRCKRCNKDFDPLAQLSLHEVMAFLPGNVYWINPKHEMVGCNENVAKSLGFNSPADVCGKNLLKMFEGEELKQYLEQTNPVFANGERVSCEFSFMGPEGKMLTYNVINNPVFDAVGNVIGLVGMAMEKTNYRVLERKVNSAQNKIQDLRAEINDADNFLQNIISAIPGNVYWMDRNNVYLGCNEECAKTFGFRSRRDIVGRNNFDFVPRKQAEAFNAINNKVMNSGEAMIVEEEGETIYGTTSYLTQKAPLKNEDGYVIGLIGVSIDITEKKRLEARLQETAKKLRESNQKLTEDKQRYLQFIENVNKQVTGADLPNQSLEEQILFIRGYLENIIGQMPGNVYWLDKNNHYLGCNNGQAAFLGLKSRYDILGKSNSDFISQEQAAIMDSDNDEVIRTSEPHSLEEEVNKAGEIIHYLTKKVPLLGKYGDTIGMLGISMDITERKAMEAELELARDQAELASKAKTEFILNMEHDIRTPIAHIISFSDILANGDKLPAEKMSEYLRYINNSGQKLMDLIGEILAFANIESGNIAIKSNTVVLQDLVNDVVLLEMPALQSKGLEFIVEGLDDLPNFHMDQSRIHRILLNLVGNAIKYTEEGWVKLRFEFKEEGEGLGDLSISVIDTGIGIPEEKKTFIFERFARLIPSNKNKFQGLGLGLWIVRQFVGDLGGEISVVSAVGEGSAFTVQIPVKVVTK